MYGASATWNCSRREGILLAGWPGRFIYVQLCGGLCMVLLRLGTVREEKGISSWFLVSTLSRYDLSY